MPASAVVVSPARSLGALTSAIGDLKAGDPLAPVTVVVPTNQSGVMARRALGRERGIAGVDMVTLNRLAELLAGPALATAGRRPVSTPVLDLTIGDVLRRSEGRFALVAEHPSTVIALRELHRELRLADPEGVARLAATWRGSEPVRISRAVTRQLERRWYDEADLLATATASLADAVPGSFRNVVVYLPEHPDHASLLFLRELATAAAVRIVVSTAGTAAHRTRLAAWLPTVTDAVSWPPDDTGVAPAPIRLVSTTDADDEARIAVDAVMRAARGADGKPPVAFERIAILWPTAQPYARLLEHHLDGAGIAWNGPSGTRLAERLAPRLLLDLLDVDRRGLRRSELFELLADVPLRDDDGRRRPIGEWERVSRAAGVSHGNWSSRLERMEGRDRWERPAAELRGFVEDLHETLGDRRTKQSWKQWVGWCEGQLESWLGPNAHRHMSDADYRAWESVVRVLERLSFLDEVAEPVTRGGFRAVLEGELDEASTRQGRVGAGVTIGPLAASTGLDVDVTVVVGAAEGLLPPAPRRDPLLADADRRLAGLASADHWADRLEENYRTAIVSSDTVVTAPRGDLRTTADRHPSRWVHDWWTPDEVELVRSRVAGLRATPFAASERVRRLRDRLRGVEAGHRIEDLCAGDDVAVRSLGLRLARASTAVTPFDGDLSSVSVPRLDGAVSPTQLEVWARCPHAYFVQYLLGVRRLEEPESEVRITPLERGSLQHEALDRFHRDVVAGRLPPPGRAGWEDAHRARLLAHGEEVCDEWEAHGRAGRPATWVAERRRVLADLALWLEHDSATMLERDAELIASEWGFTADDGARIEILGDRSLLFKGKVDRIDRTPDGLTVTDHKTGRAGDYKAVSAEDPTLGGTHFQLAAYAAAARTLAAASGFDGDPTVRAEYSMLGRGDYARHGVVFDEDVWARVSASLSEVVGGIESGWFPPRPPKPGFRVRVECAFCEADGLGTTEAYERFERKLADPRAREWLGLEGADDA